MMGNSNTIFFWLSAFIKLDFYIFG